MTDEKARLQQQHFQVCSNTQNFKRK